MAHNARGVAAWEWGPVGACAGLLFAVLVWLGITACGAGDIAGIIAAHRGSGGGGGTGPIHPAPQYLAMEGAPSGLLEVSLAFTEEADGTLTPQCKVEEAGFAGLDVLAVERVVLGVFRSIFIFIALVQTPGSDENQALAWLDNHGATGRIPLPPGFEGGALAVDLSSYMVYIAERFGNRIATVDLGAGTSGIVTPMIGATHALHLAGDIRYGYTVYGEPRLWVTDLARGSLVMLNRSGEYLETVVIDPSARDVAIDQPEDRSALFGGSELTDILTDGALWEMAGSHVIRISDVTDGTTISSHRSGTVGFTARAGDSSFASYLREPDVWRIRELQRFDPGWRPVAQVTEWDQSFIALREEGSAGATRISCPYGADILVPGNARAFAIKRETDTPPPPPAPSEPVHITIGTTPVRAPITVDGQTYQKEATVLWAPGSTHHVSVPPSVVVDTRPFTFIGWQHGDPKPDITIAAPAVPTAFVAVYGQKGQ